MAEKLAETLLGKNVKMDPAELANLDTAKLIELQMQQLEKERNDLVSKTKSTAKRMDHLERALRKVEIPLLKIDYETQQKQDRDNYELKKKVGIEYAKAKHKQDIFTKEKVSKILDDYNIFKKQLDGVRDEQFKVLKAESSVKFESAKKKLIAERQAKKISDQKKTEEEAQRCYCFYIRLIREDKQRAEDAIRRELEDAERAGTDAKRDEMFKKQQERERLAEEKIAAAKSTNAAASGSWTVPKPSSSSGAGSSRPTVRDAAAPSDGAPEIWKPSGVSWRDKASVTPTPFHGSRPAPTNGSTFGSGRTNSGATTPHNTATRENPFGNASARAPIQKSNPPSASSSPPSTGPHKYVHPNRLKKDGVGKKE
jgi:translation initiation factor 3 subunit A